MGSLSTVLSILGFVMTEFPKIQTVITDVTGMVKGTAPANHPNTGVSGGKPNETIRSLQKLYNKIFKPAKPIKEDGLFGTESEGAVKDALAHFGYAL